MTQVTINAHLDNSPKKEFLKDFNVAFAIGNADFIVDHVSHDISWFIHGDKTIRGKDQFTKEMDVMKDYTADEVIIHSIITHGSEAAVNGEMKMGGKTYVFCDIYKFTSAGGNAIKEMNSYVIGIK